MEDMSCQQPSLPQLCQPYFSQQYCFENQGILEEPDSFIDAVSYSESDGYISVPMVRSVPSHDIQELYFRKPMISSSQISSAPKHSRCCLTGHCPVSTEYIYEFKPRPPPHLSVAQSVFAAQAVPRRSSSAYATPPKALYLNNSIEKASQRKTFSEASSFRSASALPVTVDGPNSVETPHASTDDKLGGIKRFPVMYRTARYLRKPLIPSFKKEPLTAEPLLHKHSRALPKRLPRTEVPLGVSRSQEVKSSLEDSPDVLRNRTDADITDQQDAISVRKMNSEGDAPHCDADITNLDTIERIVATLDENESEDLTEEHKKEIRKMSKFLMPRVPTSVRILRQKLNKEQEKVSEINSVKNELSDDKPEQRKSSQVSFKESLDNILDQLENCEMSLNAVRSKYSTNRADPKTPGKPSLSKENTAEEEIFNLREISDKMSKSSYGNWDKTTIEACDSKQSDETLESTVKEKSSITLPNSGSGGCLDDVSAIELHRSKSYIVNLIDRALSKELGTIPKERMTKKEFQGLTPAKAINRINRNCRVDNEIYDRVKGMNEHVVNCITSPESKESDSSMSHEGEPAYIKQLKELRWGHFKHIQQEVKRLEDLERFLDTCSTPCGSSY